MLEIDRQQNDERPAPSAEQAQLARDAAKDALEQLRLERATLPGLHAEAVQRGDFASARSIKDKMALLADHVVFAEGQLVRAEAVLVECELADAEHEAQQASAQLVRAFADEEQARKAHQQASAARAGAQAQQQAYQLRVESLRRSHADARRRLEKESP